MRSAAPVLALALVLVSCTGDTGDLPADGSSEEVSAAGLRSSDPTTTDGVSDDPTTTTSTTTTTAATTTTTTTTTTSPPTTTTSTTTTTAAPAASPSSGPIGVIGCSNTHQAVNGYLSLSTIDALTGGDLGGGSVPRWGLPNGDDYALYWGLYDARRPAAGYSATWLNLCLRSGEHGGAFDDAEKSWITHIIEQVHVRDPGITIWVSPLNFYADGHVCTSTGVDGPAIAAAAADWAGATFANVARGPDLGPLEPSHIGVRDDCHPNGAGESLLGQQLVSFFD